MKLEVFVSGKISQKMDHRSIKINIHLMGVEPRRPVYRRVVRKVRIKNDEDISRKLKNLARKFEESYEPIILHASSINGRIADACASGYLELIKKIKDFGWNEKIVELPDCVKDDDEITVMIGYERAKMEKQCLKLRHDPNDVISMEVFEKAEAKLLN